MDRKIWLLMGVLVFLSASTSLYVLAWDMYAVISQPTMFANTSSTLAADSGRFFLDGQNRIVSALDELKKPDELPFQYRNYLNNQIIGGAAFSILLVLIVFSIIKFFVKGTEYSLKDWLVVFFITLLIVAILQFVITFLVYHRLELPFNGFWQLFLNLDTFVKSIMMIEPKIGV